MQVFFCIQFNDKFIVPDKNYIRGVSAVLFGGIFTQHLQGLAFQCCNHKLRFQHNETIQLKL
jgi:hypothetical protein